MSMYGVAVAWPKQISYKYLPSCMPSKICVDYSVAKYPYHKANLNCILHDLVGCGPCGTYGVSMTQRLNAMEQLGK